MHYAYCHSQFFRHLYSFLLTYAAHSFCVSLCVCRLDSLNVICRKKKRMLHLMIQLRLVCFIICAWINLQWTKQSLLWVFVKFTGLNIHDTHTQLNSRSILSVIYIPKEFIQAKQQKKALAPTSIQSMRDDCFSQSIASCVNWKEILTSSG